jgi:O-antigen/teichoic acid export membrane protein
MTGVTNLRSLKGRLIQGGVWLLVGYGVSQVLRFGSNLVLTRLLFPEAFGMMAIIQAIVAGIAMVSDIGIAQSLIRSKDAEQASFVNTAWTLQVGQGLILFTVLLIIGQVMVSLFDQQVLGQMVQATALVALVSAFGSTKVVMATRRLEPKGPLLLDLSSQVIGSAASIVLAFIDPTPFSLIWGNFIASITKVVGGHTFFSGERNRILIDRDALSKILGFGSWIALSSGLTFVAGEGQKLILGVLLDAKLLALVTLASTLNLTLWHLIRQVGPRLFFPAYSEVYRSHPTRLNDAVRRSRLIQIVPTWIIASMLLLYGQEVIDWLYDSRYSNAGLILRILAAGLMIGVLEGSFMGVSWAIGRAQISTHILLAQIAIQFSCYAIGWLAAGPMGVLISLSGSIWLLYPVSAYIYWREGFWHPSIDLPVIVATLGMVSFAFRNEMRAIASL